MTDTKTLVDIIDLLDLAIESCVPNIVHGPVQQGIVIGLLEAKGIVFGLMTED